MSKLKPATTPKRYARLSNASKWRLFLIGAFPIHLWSIISQLWQVGDRHEFFERAAYGLSFALFESLVVFLLLLAMYFMLPKRWGEDRIITSSSVLYFAIAFWAIVRQVYFMLNKSQGTFWFRAFGYVGRHQTPFLILLIVGIILSLIIPLWSIHKFERFRNSILTLLERIGTLTTIYLLFDLAGIVTIIIRNI